MFFFKLYADHCERVGNFVVHSIKTKFDEKVKTAILKNKKEVYFNHITNSNKSDILMFIGIQSSIVQEFIKEIEDLGYKVTITKSHVDLTDYRDDLSLTRFLNFRLYSNI